MEAWAGIFSQVVGGPQDSDNDISENVKDMWEPEDGYSQFFPRHQQSIHHFYPGVRHENEKRLEFWGSDKEKEHTFL
jgi:hypothetical protein